MSGSNTRRKAARQRATSQRSRYLESKRRGQEMADHELNLRPGGNLVTPMADELIWGRVLRPRAPLVYLDLNHYIYLARADQQFASSSGAKRALPGYVDLAAAARAAKATGRALFPLSGVHMMELSKVKDPRQRADVAAVMEDLSDFTYLLDRVTLSRLEIDAGLDHIHSEMLGVDHYTPLVAPSFAHAFGRTPPLGHANWTTDMNRQMERAMLRGPSDDQVDDLLARGWDPDAFARSQQSRLDFELDLSARLAKNPHWRQGRLRDVISGREVFHEWNDIFARHLLDRHRLGLRDDRPSVDQMASFWAAMPQVQVAISLKTRYHRNPARRWKRNDISDIDAMSIAYPYCDAVFTDKEARSALVDDRALRRIETFMPKRPDELTTWLNDLPPHGDPSELLPLAAGSA